MKKVLTLVLVIGLHAHAATKYVCNDKQVSKGEAIKLLLLERAAYCTEIREVVFNNKSGGLKARGK